MSIGRLGIIGAGSVGSAVAFAAATAGVAREIVIHDIDGSRAEAEALDLRHGTPFVAPVEVAGSDDASILAGCDVVVMTAGAKQKPGQSRLDLAATNAEMCRRALGATLEVAPDAIVLLVTNPVDVITQVARAVHPAPDGLVFGSGTVLDTARLRVLLADHLGVAVTSVHATIVGEHGDSEFALWSGASVGGAPIDAWLAARGEDRSVLDRIVDDVRGAAQRIIAGKGATSTAIGLSTARILRAIGDDERAVLPVSTLHRIDGVGEVCLSMPTVVGAAGTADRVPVDLDDAEQAALLRSAATIRAAVEAVDAASVTHVDDVVEEAHD